MTEVDKVIARLLALADIEQACFSAATDWADRARYATAWATYMQAARVVREMLGGPTRKGESDDTRGT